MKFQIPKGLFDILPYDLKDRWKCVDYWQYVESVIHEISHTFGFKEIRTPIFEYAELFDRGVGLTSDIVSKEMYLFKDKSERLLALRPEGTSSVIRAYIENNLLNYSKNHKLYYIAPMFRYERPQAGRYRQHFQFGVEAIGIASFQQDVEIIDLLWQFFQRLNLKNIELNINSIGDVECRDKYKSALIKYLSPNYDKLSKDSQARFKKNPLRILDSKDQDDKVILENAPNILDYLSDDSSKHFNQVCSLLDEIKIPYIINPKIVRGLDYYNRTVFEFLCNDLGSQNALGAGGRYDGFTEVFQGKAQPGIGFGCGLERIIHSMIFQKIEIPKLTNPFIFLIPLDEKSSSYSFLLMNKLRSQKIPTEMDLEFKKIATSLKKANQKNAKFVAIIGSDEIETNTIKLKDMQLRTEISLSLNQIEKTLKDYWGKNEQQ
jgi:histidyl-tRNA synthetase